MMGRWRSPISIFTLRKVTCVHHRGYVARFHPPRPLAAGEELFLHIGVNAGSPWTGLLSVEVKDGKIRARVRRCVLVERRRAAHSRGHILGSYVGDGHVIHSH